MNNWLIKLRIILWGVLLATVFWLFNQAVVPTGKINYFYNFNHPSHFIGQLTPVERVDLPKNGQQKIINQPIYFSLHTPRRFDRAKLILRYQNLSQSPIIEAGVLVDKTIWRYELQPLENKIIDQLALVWPTIESKNGEILLQREKKYLTVEDFLNNLPAFEQLATYYYDLKVNYRLPDYQATSQKQAVDCALRGAYQFYTYLKNEKLNFIFTVIDLNQNKDSDEVDLYLSYQDQLLETKHLVDDGINSDQGQVSQPRLINLELDNLPEGVYKIELKASSDIVTKKIETFQNKLAIINKLRLAEGCGKVNLYTDSGQISAQTTNPAKLQKIKAGSKELDLAKTYQQFFLITDSGLKLVELAKDDLLLAGDSLFSFSQESFFNPTIKKINYLADLTEEKINYLITKYQTPLLQDDFKIATAEFDLTKAYRENNKYSFLISIPGLKSTDQQNEAVILKQIKIELQGKSLLEKITGEN